MRRLFSSTLFILCSLSAATAFGYGEGADIPIEARAIHLLTNEARCNTHEALASCGTKCGEAACYDESMGPVYWNDNLTSSINHIKKKKKKKTLSFLVIEKYVK